jgi:hypothetical protein
MNRAAAVQYLTNQFGASTESLITRMAIPTTDDGAMAAIVDDALLALGVADGDLATGDPSNTLGYRATLRYMALRFAIANLNNTELLGTVASGTDRISTEEWRRSLTAQLQSAWAEAVGYGVSLPNPDGSDGAGLDALIAAYGDVGYDLNFLGCR